MLHTSDVETDNSSAHTSASVVRIPEFDTHTAVRNRRPLPHAFEHADHSPTASDHTCVTGIDADAVRVIDTELVVDKELDGELL